MSSYSDTLRRTTYFHPSKSVLFCLRIPTSPRQACTPNFLGTWKNLRHLLVAHLTLDFPLVRDSKITEGPTSENDIIDSLVLCHPAPGEWSCVHEDVYLAQNVFLDGRGGCSLPLTVNTVALHQNVFLLITILFRSTKYPSGDYTSTKNRVNQVRSVNETNF